MYQKILVALENSQSDQSLIPHITELAKQCGSTLVLIHVADGWAARNYALLQLAESEEMKADRAYLEQIADRMREAGLTVKVVLALGDPPTEILKVSVQEGCDLIAMTTHGHRLIGDLILGSTIHEVRHRSEVPLLLVRDESKKR